MTRIAVGSDHAGFTLKESIGAHLRAGGHAVIDVGTHSTDSADYPVYGAAAAREVAAGRAELAVLVCGSGVGIGIAANSVPGIRCATCSEPYTAHISRAHNDANALAIGARVVGEGLALDIVDAFLDGRFEGGRHQRRVDQLTALEAGEEL